MTRLFGCLIAHVFSQRFHLCPLPVLFSYNIQVAETLLQTKLFIPPSRPNLVARSRLVEQLSQGLGLGHKLSLISAPAGFGKTTLVVEWVGGLRLHAAEESQTINKIAWLSLDEGDNDPTRFLAYLVMALRRAEGIEAALGESILDMLQSPQPPPADVVLISLLNEVAANQDRVILILDDYHLIDSPPVDGALAFLLDHLPPLLHLVIATREDPHLPLARLRARGQLTELRAIDLRFSSAEAAEFLNQVMGLNLSGEDVAALETRTEGWIAGLQLAAISMQGRGDVANFIRSFTGSHHFVLDYLVEEVLDQQPESIQTFLLQTAVLDRLTGSLCDAVQFDAAETPSSSERTALTGQQDGRATLEFLEQANLFIVSLDEERHWYRYHHLFSDLLRKRLRQKQPDWVSSLHIRASEWYQQNGFAEEAIEHSLRAQEFDQAAQLIDDQIDAIWMRGEHTKLRRWLGELPVELVLSKPQLCIFHALYLFTSGQWEAAERGLQAAEQALEPGGYGPAESSLFEQGDQLSESDRMKLRGRLEAIRAFIGSYSQANVPGIIQHASQALEYLPEQDLTMRSMVAIALGDAYALKGEMTAAYEAQLEATKASKAAGNNFFLIVANLKMAGTLREQGRLQRTVEICRQQLQLANKSGLSQAGVTGWLLAVWGEALAELNDLDGALHQTKQGVELVKRGGDVAMLSWSYLCLVRVSFSQGDTSGLETIIQRTEKIGRESDMPPWFTNQMSAWQTRLWLAQDKLALASQWAEERGLTTAGKARPAHELDYFWLIEYVVLARLLLAQERLEEAAQLLSELLGAAEKGGRTSRVIEILILQALAFQAKGDTEQAIITMERAVRLAEQEGFTRIFVDEGPPMRRLLSEALSREMAPDYIRRLLAAFPAAEQEQATPVFNQTKTRSPESEMVESLSERELEVLQFVAQGLTNQEIASRLFLSLNTVKVHTRNIHGKLGVHSRTQAVARARTLGILA